MLYGLVSIVPSEVTCDHERYKLNFLSIFGRLIINIDVCVLLCTNQTVSVDPEFVFKEFIIFDKLSWIHINVISDIRLQIIKQLVTATPVP